MKIFALIFGIVFLSFGIVGFIDIEFMNKYFIKIFKSNAWNSSLYLITGIISIIMTLTNRRTCILFFKVLGTCFAILAMLGFFYGNAKILGIFASNSSNTWFHVIVSIAALVLGYGASDQNSG